MPGDGLTFALDVDLDTVDLRDGLRQMIAVGSEGRMGQHFYLRGGFRMSLRGVRGPTGSVGASLELKKGYWLDGQFTHGGVGGDHGFGITLRKGS